MTKDKSSVPADDIIDSEDIDEVTKQTKAEAKHTDEPRANRAGKSRRSAVVIAVILALVIGVGLMAGGQLFRGYQNTQQQQTALFQEMQAVITAQQIIDRNHARLREEIARQKTEIARLQSALDTQKQDIERALKMAGSAAHASDTTKAEPALLVALLMFQSAQEGGALTSYEMIVTALPEGDQKDWLLQVITQAGSLSETALIASGFALLGKTADQEAQPQTQAAETSFVSRLAGWLAEMVSLRPADDKARPNPITMADTQTKISDGAPEVVPADLLMISTALAGRSDEPAKRWLAEAAKWQSAMMTLEAFLAMMMTDQSKQNAPLGEERLQ